VDHSLFENAAAVASGIEVALKALGRDEEGKVVVIAGDGGTVDIGIQPFLECSNGVTTSATFATTTSVHEHRKTSAVAPRRSMASHNYESIRQEIVRK